jgi:uncharacterized protein YecT (DUF1311 family)
MRRALGLVFCAVLIAGAAFAQAQKVDPRDAAAVDACIKEARGKNRNAETCIGTVAEACLSETAGQATARAEACYSREHLVWEEMLGATYERLRKGLSGTQATKLQSSQKVWLEARKQGCEFYWEFLRGTAASPLASACYMRETASRAIYLQYFADHSKK